METIVEKNCELNEHISTNLDQPIENTVQENSNNGDSEQKLEVSPEEIRRITELMASTGKFWHDWIFLRGILSYELKQVLAEYPEAQQQNSVSGETYSELVKRLDDALLSFEEGPPFTLQRLCEILLSPKSTYMSLSKLALALEKNLLVTSTLTRCTDPYPTISSSPEEKSEEINASNMVPTLEIVNPNPKTPNGGEANSVAQPVASDGDEEMPDAEPEPEEEQNPDPNPNPNPNPNTPDVEMQDEEKVIQEEEKVTQDEVKLSNDETGTGTGVSTVPVQAGTDEQVTATEPAVP